jgi:hypothetical protein
MFYIKPYPITTIMYKGNEKFSQYNANLKREWINHMKHNVKYTCISMDSTQCNCEIKVQWLTYTIRETQVFTVFFIIHTFLRTNYQHTLPPIYTHCLKSNLCFGHRKMEGWLHQPAPFLCLLFYSTPTFLWKQWPHSQRETHKSMVKSLGVKVRVSNYGAGRHSWK